MGKMVGQASGQPPGYQQDALPVNHKRTQKVAPTVNRAGGAHPAARRALSPRASQRAKRNTQMNSIGNDIQDQALNSTNAMDQDAMPTGTMSDPTGIGNANW
jgi:hypothetical protein